MLGLVNLVLSCINTSEQFLALRFWFSVGVVALKLYRLIAETPCLESDFVVFEL